MPEVDFASFVIGGIADHTAASAWLYPNQDLKLGVVLIIDTALYRRTV